MQVLGSPDKKHYCQQALPQRQVTLVHVQPLKLPPAAALLEALAGSNSGTGYSNVMP